MTRSCMVTRGSGVFCILYLRVSAGSWTFQVASGPPHFVLASRNLSSRIQSSPFAHTGTSVSFTCAASSSRVVPGCFRASRMNGCSDLLRFTNQRSMISSPHRRAAPGLQTRGQRSVCLPHTIHASRPGASRPGALHK